MQARLVIAPPARLSCGQTLTAKAALVPDNPPHPYYDLPASAYWRSGVAAQLPGPLTGLWEPAFPIAPGDGVATFGSCFAQHFGRALRARGYRWVNFEPPPRKVPQALSLQYGYRQFSARTGNIYTPTLFLQWLRWAFDQAQMPPEGWPDGARLRDPFRPRLEPDGFTDSAEMHHMRRVTLRALRNAVRKARVLVFTLGLTERWVDADTGLEYPLCPGTAGGRFDPARHAFAPLDYPQALAAMADAMDLMRTENPDLRFLLTVSPVPLAATASGAHVLCATSGSKAILRAVAGALAETRPDTDYFPSYEIISSPVHGGRFFGPDMRQVTQEGVDLVMDSFFGTMATRFPDNAPAPPAPSKPLARDVVCEEELYAAFGPRA